MATGSAPSSARMIPMLEPPFRGLELFQSRLFPDEVIVIAIGWIKIDFQYPEVFFVQSLFQIETVGVSEEAVRRVDRRENASEVVFRLFRVKDGEPIVKKPRIVDSVLFQRVRNFPIESPKPVLEFPDCPPPDKRIIGLDDIPAEIDTLSHRLKDLLFRMKFQMQFRFDKRLYPVAPDDQLLLGTVKKQKIIHVAEIMAALESVFYELIQLVEINVGKKLAGQIADGKTAVHFAEKGFMRRYGSQELLVTFQSVIRGRIMKNDLFGKPKKFRVIDSLFDKRKQDALVYGHEKTLDICLEKKQIGSDGFLEVADGFVGTLVLSAGI